MTKPTLMQSLLNRPSQTYSFPHDRQYFSTKRDMLRIATEAKHVVGGADPNDAHTDEGSRPRAPADGPSSQARSMASPDVEPLRMEPGIDSLTPDSDSVMLQSQSPQIQSNHVSVSLPHHPHDDDSDSDQDVFYTPDSSPRNSMASSVAVPFPTPPRLPKASISTRTPAPNPSTSTTSLSSTIATTSLDGHSLFSSASTPLSDSTRLTTPVNSDAGHAPPSKLPRTTYTTRNTDHTAHHSAYSYTDEDWAKDVRWLVTPGSASKSTITPSPSTKPKRRSKSLLQSESSHSSTTYLPPTSHMSYSQPPPVRKKNLSKSMSKTTPSIMMSMTALLEEDEDPANNPAHPSPKSSVLISGPSRLRTASSPNSHQSSTSQYYSDSNTGSGPVRTASTSTSASRPPRNTSPTPSSASPRPHLQHRRSRSLGHSATPPFFSDSTVVSSSTYTPSLPSHGTPGYTSLTLPRAPPPPSMGVGKVGAGADGKVDLTRSGIAQTTMASVEVVRGLGGKTAGGGFSIPFLGRRKTTGSGARERERSKSRGRGERPLGFTSHRAPPGYVPSGSVLVQVWAVGIDTVDGRLVGGSTGGGGASESGFGFGFRLGRSKSLKGKDKDKREEGSPSTSASGGSAPVTKKEQAKGAKAGETGTTPDVGYIPGRSFVGRVLECGWEVREEVVRKGEWVVGLLDVRKCGALAEFIVVDRHRVHRVPYPRMGKREAGLLGLDPGTDQNPSPLDAGQYPSSSQSVPPSRSASSSSRTHPRSRSLDITSPLAPTLTLEEFALLPLTGVPAYRAIRTLAFAFAPPREGKSGVAGGDHESGHGRRALVLRGHDGVGAMAVQMLVKRGWRVCAHAPLPLSGGEHGVAGGMELVEERVRAWGGDEVVFDDGGWDADGEGDVGAVVRVIQNLREDGDVFDAVLDTVGGREVWEAAERLLRVGGPKRRGRGQFTTLVGDVPGRPIPSAGDHFKAGLRSLRLGGGGRSKSAGGADEAKGASGGGKVGYAWVSAAQDVDWEGQDVREGVGAVLQMALDDGVRPWVGGGGWGGDGDEVVEKARVVTFERAPEVFGDGGPLGGGGTVVVRIVG